MNHEPVRRRRAKIAASLPPLTEILRGSLLERSIRHKSGCPKCARGGSHPALVLTIGYPGGKTKQFSIRPEMRQQVQQWLDNYRRIRAGLEQICELNHAFLRPSN